MYSCFGAACVLERVGQERGREGGDLSIVIRPTNLESSKSVGGARVFTC